MDFAETSPNSNVRDGVVQATPGFTGLLVAHQKRRTRAREAAMQRALGHARPVEYTPLVQQLQKLLQQETATRIFEAAVDRQVGLMRIKEREVNDLLRAATAAEGKEKVELAEAARKALAELEELEEALEDVAEA